MKLFSLFALLLLIACTSKRDNLAVIFSKIGEPEQITENGKEHLYASYYGINSFSESETYATVLKKDVKLKDADSEIKIINKNGQEVIHKKVGDSGIFTVELPEFSVNGEKKIYYSPYTIVVGEKKRDLELNKNTSIKL